MADSVYLLAAEPNVGSSEVIRTYLNVLENTYEKVGVFRAFTNGGEDPLLRAALSHIGRLNEVDRAWGVERSAYAADEASAMNTVLGRYRAYAADKDAVLILGVLDGDPIYPGALARSARCAAHLGTSIVPIISGHKDDDGITRAARLVQFEMETEHAPVAAIVVTGHPSELSQPSSVKAPLITLEHLPEEVGTTFTVPCTTITPLRFEFDLIERARSQKKRIVLPEPEDDRILYATAELLDRDVADIILVGEEETIRARARELGLNIDRASIVAIADDERLARYATEFARLREKKGVTYDQAYEKCKDVSYFATMMVHMGDADGMVSGAAHTTSHTIVPSFQIIKTRPGTKIVSSVFLMLLEDRVYVYGDCAVNPNPTPEQLADIAISSAQTAAQFGVEPRIAMLSYSTGTSGAGPDVDAVREATEIVRRERPDLVVEGPIQYDAAVDKAVASAKLPNSPVAGKATVLIFPSLNAGNIGYKAVQRSSGAVAVGPVLQGLNKPVNDLSRGALVADIVNTVAITAIQAQ